MVTKPYLPLFTFTLLVLFVTLLFSSPYKVTANEVAPRRQTSSPVGFLEHLKGSHKGDKVKGINDLKKYLDKYGYLDCKNHNHPEDDFDEHLEEAVRVYQINFNLDPTGILDKETISTMMKPRCGVADIINGTTSMRIAKMKHNYIKANEAALSGKISSPVGFLEHLKGSHKGDKVKGLNDLKKYLHKYGYLDCKNHNHAENDFDEHLEGAVRVYQINFNLNPTGILDDETISSMMKPRCGVADIINDTTYMRVATMKHNYSEVPIRVRYKVNPGYAKWPKYKLAYAILPPTPGVCKGPTKSSFQIWQKSSPFKFSQTQNPQTSDIRVSGHKREPNSDDPFDGPLGALAHAFYPTTGDFHYDLEDRWTANPVQGDMWDCMGVALHEIGHLLGLDHSSVYGAVMYPHSGVFRALHQDDVQGLKALYKF